MRLLFYIATVWLLLLCAVSGKEIDYRGAPPRNRSQFERYVRRLAANTSDDRALADSVALRLRDSGYLDGAASVNDDQMVVTAGEQYRFDCLRVVEDSSVAFEIGEPFTEAAVTGVMDRFLNQYRSRGHYYADAIIQRLIRNDQDITIELSLRPGPIAQITENIYLGLERTDPGIVTRYFDMTPGDTLTDDLIGRAEKDAAGIDFLEFLPPAVVRPRAGYTEAALEFRFKEKRQVQLVGGGGYIPNDATGLVWNLDLKLSNLFGDGRKIQLQSERRAKGRTVLDVQYRQPVFVLGVGQLAMAVATRDYRDKFYEFRVSAAYELRGDNLDAGLQLSWKRVESAVSLAGYSRLAVTFSISRSRLDNLDNPSRGSDMTWGITFAQRRYNNDSLSVRPERSVLNETASSVRLGFFHPVCRGLVGHLKLDYTGLETGEKLPPESELTFIGGPGSIRCFRTEQFLAQRAAIATVEPRLRFNQGYFFIFHDAAYINRPTLDAGGRVVTDEFYRFGYGLGMALLDAGRILRLSLGWNRELAFDQPRLSIEFTADL